MGWRAEDIRKRRRALPGLHRTLVETQKAPSRLERTFALLWQHEFHGPTLHAEFAFDPERNWRFDFAHLSTKVAIEIEGGSKRGRSRHTTWDGFVGDCEKYNRANILGWTVFRLPPEHLKPKVLESLIDFIRRREESSDLIRDTLECLTECNAQDPQLLELDRCPAGHPNECGVCEVRRRLEQSVSR